jgi:hypothetical protein
MRGKHLAKTKGTAQYLSGLPSHLCNALYTTTENQNRERNNMSNNSAKTATHAWAEDTINNMRDNPSYATTPHI